jgi:serine/threonine protein kinase/WD40 repeat protein
MNAPEREAAIAAEARALPPTAREAFLDKACAGDPALRARVGALLSASEAARDDTSASRPVSATAAAAALRIALDEQPEETAGATIGPYKLLQPIGQGGFGTVWMAEQQEPIRRRVALKVIKLGMDTREVIARFEAERQALALMEHPNIARVFDAGATKSGRPYFVMELVRGVAITRYCDDQRLSPAARLKLFVSVCQGVQHAHQKGVIHRDLKPSNILVTLHDGVPVPKIIDFGIAKATTGARLTEKTLFTQFHAFVGTPVYTSPEQMEMSGLDVDTRSDVYSLGVLLYELLAGRPPFDANALVKSGLEAMRRTIREIDPPRPSRRLHTLSAEERTTVARQRDTDVGKLQSLLHGDLDCIAMRCLEKDRTRRYETASALAADIERHLAHEPVTARPRSATYRTGKFIRRHRIGVAAVAAVGLSLLGGLTASSVSLMRERKAHARAAASERAEAKLRREADAARVAEALRVSETSRDLAGRFLAEGRTAEGLAHLVQAVRKNPADPTLAPYLVSALASRSFLLPVGPPVKFPSRISNLLYVDGGGKLAVYCDDGTIGFIDRASGAVVRARLPAGLAEPGVVFAGRVTIVRGADNVLRVLTPTSGRVERDFAFPRGIVRVAVVRPDDPRIFAVLDDASLAVADVSTNQVRIHPLALPAAGGAAAPRLLGAMPSPDGRWVATFFAGVQSGQIWDAETGALMANHPVPGALLYGCFTPDSRRILTIMASASEEVRMAVWSLPDLGEVVAPRALPAGRSSDNFQVTFSADGRFFSVAAQHGQQLYTTDTAEAVGAFLSPTGFTTSPMRSLRARQSTGLYPPGDACVFLPSRERPRYLTSSSLDARPELAIRDVATGAAILPPLKHPSGLGVVLVSDDGDTLLATNGERYLMLWDLRTGQVLGEPGGQLVSIGVELALSPHGDEVAMAGDDRVLWRLGRGRGVAQPLVLPRTPPYTPAPFLAGTPARLLWLRRDRGDVIDVASGRTVESFPFPEPILGLRSSARDIAVRADLGYIVVRLEAGGWRAWRMGGGKITRSVPLQDATSGTDFVCFSEAGNRVAMIPADRANTVRVWDLTTGRSVGPPLEHGSDIRPSNVRPGCFSHDGRRFVCGSSTGIVRIWDCETGAIVAEWTVPPGARVPFVDVSLDDTRIATRNLWGEVQLWNSADGRPITDVLGGTRGGAGLAFSPDGNRLLTWGGSARVWDASSGMPVSEPMAQLSLGMRWAAFSADSGRVVTAGSNSTAQVWDARTGRPLTEPLPHASRVVRCAFSPDGRYVCTEPAGGSPIWTSFNLWSVPFEPGAVPAPEWLLRLATAVAGRGFDGSGKCVEIPDALAQVTALRRELAALPDNSPFVAWGRWMLDERPDRPIAPGFTITPAEAAQIARTFAERTIAAPSANP